MSLSKDESYYKFKAYKYYTKYNRLFVKLRENFKLNEALSIKIKDRIKNNCSPRHVPALIIECPDIPRTKNGKIVEITVRRIINGDNIDNLEAIANPQSLEFYKKLNLN